MKYKDKQMAALFPSTIDYYFKKLFEGCRREDSGAFTSIHVNLLKTFSWRFVPHWSNVGLSQPTTTLGTTWRTPSILWRSIRNTLMATRQVLSMRRVVVFSCFSSSTNSVCCLNTRMNSMRSTGASNDVG